LSAEHAAWILALACGLAIAASPATADTFRTAELRVQEGGEAHSLVMLAQLPADVAADGAIGWPEGCRQTGLQRHLAGEHQRIAASARCDRPPQPGATIRAPWRVDAARVRFDGELESRAVQATTTGLAIPVSADPIPPRPWTVIAPAMGWQGVLHIALGWDHLAFVLCLCLLVRGLPLIGLVTAFTLGHSLSLGLAYFDLLRLPIPPVEALIALSIILLAREGLLARPGAPPALMRTTGVVVIFGLVHGLGFASALSALDIAPSERWPALLAFNVGVELGQLAIIAGFLALLSLLARRSWAEAAGRAVGYGAGITGAYWMIERVAGFPWG
jgi:hypothetical protein